MIWWFLGVVALVLSGWGGCSTFWALHPNPRSLFTPLRLPSVKVVPLVSHEGRAFEVWILEAHEPRGAIIACHGYYANRLQLIEIATGLCQRGYTVLLFDLRGHGVRPGPCTFGVDDVKDIGAILVWLRQQSCLAQLPVGLFGLSLGGAIACQAGAWYSEVGAIVVDSLYARLFPILARAIRQEHHLPTIPWAWVTWLGIQMAVGRRLSQIDPVALAAESKRPLLLIHGGEDQSVPVEHAKTLYTRWQGPKEQWIEPHVGHIGTYASNPVGYCDRVANFFDRWLPSALPASRS